MDIWIVFEYTEYSNTVVGVFGTEEAAKKKHRESPTWRYIKTYKVIY